MANVYYESTFEEAFVELLKRSGWSTAFGPSLHRRLTDALIVDDLESYLRSHYAEKGLTEREFAAVVSKMENVSGTTHYRSMVEAAKLVRDGYDVTPKTPGVTPFHLDYIDFVHPERNIFRCVNQYEFHQGDKVRIPDVVLFVNGIPLVVIELKNPMNEHATIETAHGQITKRYRGDIPALMKYCTLAVVSDGSHTRLGTSVSGFEYFYAWKKVENEDDAKSGVGEVEKMVEEALQCTGVETILGKEVGDGEFVFGDDFMEELNDVEMPNTKFQLLVRLLKRSIRDYRKTNKVRADYFEKMLEETVEEYNTRDRLTFANEVATDTVNAVTNVLDRRIEELSAKLLDLLKGVEKDKQGFRDLGITFEEKSFYDILVDLRDTHKFEYPDDRCKALACKIKKLIDGTSVYADWLNNDNLRNQLATDLTTLLYTEGYPPDWDDEVFRRVLEQMENYKKGHVSRQRRRNKEGSPKMDECCIISSSDEERRTKGD
ncbi:MAG: DUF3387 domain-containing protein [Kiritimatiellae bacterium]|nr:DUF3387 domain-containing protein [Kiritimatiellia bacterium]